MPRKPPDFVIVGAPKTGTTSLFLYLEQHENIFFPKEKKEPLFFCEYPPSFSGPGGALLNKSMVTESDAYQALFQLANEHSLTGEASTDYLSCPKAAVNIKKWNPGVRIIIMLRNPIARAYSEHMHLVRDQFEKHSFMESLQLEAERKADGYIPLFWHRERGMYHAAVARYLEIFGKANVKIILHEDFSRSPAETTKEVFEFLGLAPIEVDVSDRSNVSGVAQWPWLQKLYIHFRLSDEQGWMKKLARVLSSGHLRQKVRVFYLSKNVKKADGPTRDEQLFLRDYFANDVSALGELLDRDLHHWLELRES